MSQICFCIFVKCLLGSQIYEADTDYLFIYFLRILQLNCKTRAGLKNYTWSLKAQCVKVASNRKKASRKQG